MQTADEFEHNDIRRNDHKSDKQVISHLNVRKLSDINTSKSQIEFTHSAHCSQQEINYDIFKLDRQHIYVSTKEEIIVKQRFSIRIKL
jgi:hypothetical protein